MVPSTLTSTGDRLDLSATFVVSSLTLCRSIRSIYRRIGVTEEILSLV